MIPTKPTPQTRATIAWAFIMAATPMTTQALQDQIMTQATQTIQAQTMTQATQTLQAQTTPQATQTLQAKTTLLQTTIQHIIACIH